MTSPVETTAAMTPPAEQHDSEDATAVSPAPGTTALAEPAPEAAASVSAVADEQAAGRRELSSNVVITLFGGLVTTLMGGLIGLMMWQFSSLGDRIDDLGDRIDGQGARIDSLGTALRAEINNLETELRADMDMLETGLRADMDMLETGLRADMGKLETGLRAEMRAGFAEINAVLLDHTDRLARLETAAGLSRSAG